MPPKSSKDKKTKARTKKSSAGASPRQKAPRSKPHGNKGEDLVVVGIGASAGGLEALQTLIPTLPEDENITYIIAQHLDPTHRSMLVPLLARHTNLKVEELKDGIEVQSGHIYVTPPDRDVTISDNQARLSKPADGVGPKPSVDYFFTSLAEAKGEQAVGLILSGTGSDGAYGIRAIKAAGGITIAQDKNTAKYTGMPGAAIETGHVDMVLKPDEIGVEIPEIIKYPRKIPIKVKEDVAVGNLQKVFRMLSSYTGADFSEYKPNTILRRMKRRMVTQKWDTIEEYVKHLERNPKELSSLYKDILISVTGFFRDPDAFASLNKVLEKMVDDKKETSSIRIWVPGCATGEEPFSIAILLTEALRKKNKKIDVQIFATDLDEDAVNQARRAGYPIASTANIDKELLKRYFTRQENKVHIAGFIKELVIFAKQNVIKDPPFSHLDLISCRNLLIYFNAELQQKVLAVFHYALDPNGYLFLGKSEAISHSSDIFSTFDKKYRIFRRKGGPRGDRLEIVGCSRFQSTARSQFLPKNEEPSVGEVVSRAIADCFGPSSVVLDERLDIVHIHGDVGAYLSLAPGDAGLNILNLAHKDLRMDLRSMVYKSRREAKKLKSRLITINGFDGKDRRVQIDVQPLGSQGWQAGMSLVPFIEEPRELESTKVTTGSREIIDQRIVELEQELATTREHLQTTVQELETSNEELQSLNEELQSANEELQSSNEELETSNEELQSTNEELTTVNQELEVKTEQLAEALAESRLYKEAFENSHDAVAVLDPKGFFIDQNKAYERLTGEPVESIRSHTPAMHLGDKTFHKVLKALARDGSFRGELESSYKDSESVDIDLSAFQVSDTNGEAKYYVAIARDITRRKKDEKALKKAKEGLEERVRERTAELVDTNKKLAREIQERNTAEEELRASEARLAAAHHMVRLGNWEWNIENNELYWYDEIYNIFGIEKDTFASNYEAFLASVHPHDLERVRKAVDAALNDGAPYSIDHRIVRPDGSERTVHEQAEVLRDEEGNAIRMVGTVQDITERKKIEEELLKGQRLESLAMLAGGIAHDFNNLLTGIAGNLSLMKHLLGNNKDGKLKARLEETERASLMAQDLTVQLLTFSKGGAPVKKLSSVADLLKDMSKLTFSGSSVKCELKVDDGLWPAEIDPGQVGQVMNNLLINSIQAMPEGGKVEVRARNFAYEPGADDVPAYRARQVRQHKRIRPRLRNSRREDHQDIRPVLYRQGQG